MRVGTWMRWCAGSARSGVDGVCPGFDHSAVAGMERLYRQLREHPSAHSLPVSPGTCARARRSLARAAVSEGSQPGGPRACSGRAPAR